METFLILIAIASLCAIAYFAFFRKMKDEQEPILTDESYKDVELPSKEPAMRPHMDYQKRIDSLWFLIVRSGPKMIFKALISFAIVSVLTGYISIKNAERFAKIGSDIASGNIVGAISSTFAFGREPTLEFINVSTGKNSYLSDNGLNEFAYIGQKDGTGYAVMKTVYLMQHHDPELSVDSNIYNKPMTDMTVSESRNLCQEKYKKHNGDLVSIEEWEWSQSNYLGSNHFDIPKSPEWTRTANEKDDDDFKVIPHEFNVKKYVKDNKIDNEENGQWVDGDDSDIFLLRCSINWKIKE
jgi:hypothetical protein